MNRTKELEATLEVLWNEISKELFRLNDSIERNPEQEMRLIEWLKKIARVLPPPKVEFFLKMKKIKCASLEKRIPCMYPKRALQECEKPKPGKKLSKSDRQALMAFMIGLGSGLDIR